MDSSSNINTIVRAQIVFLMSTLTEDNYERNLASMRTLAEQHGMDTYLHFFRRLIVQTEGRPNANTNPSNFDQTTALTFRLLVQETQRLARDPFLADRFKESIDRGEGEAFRNFDLRRFAERVNLKPLERLILYSPVLISATRKDLVLQAKSVIEGDFDEAVLALCQQSAFDTVDVTANQVAKLLSVLIAEPPSDSPVLSPTQLQALVMSAHSKCGSEMMANVLGQILPSMSLRPGTTLGQALVDLGGEITKDPDVVKSIFLRFGYKEGSTIPEAKALELISTLSNFATDSMPICDSPTVIQVLASYPSNFSWPAIIQSFDRPDRSVADTATLKLIIAILLGCPAEAKPHAVEGFWAKWTNCLYQLRLLEALVSLPSDTFNFVAVPGKRIVTVDDVATASPIIKALAANVQGQTWNSLPLFETLMRFGSSESPEIIACVRDMMEKAVRISAELVHMGLLQIPKPWSALHEEFASQMLAMFLAGHPNHQLVFMRIWQIDQSYLTQAFIDFYNKSQYNITRILDIAQDLKILETLLDIKPFTFALDVAALASRREYLNLDKWLADNINTYKAEFIRAVMEFLEAKAASEKEARVHDPPIDGKTMALNPQTVAIFLRVLRNNSALLSPADVDVCLEIRNTCLQIYPRLMSLIPGTDQEPGFSVTSYTAEIEKEVDGLYRQMYEETLSVDQVISMLQRFKASKNPKEHEIFACMLHFLFDEFRFFNTYPAPQLALTAFLFGSLIEFSLVDYIPLGIAIRYILDALACPPDSNLFKFAIMALARFESRLPEWQPLCQALLQIPHLQEARPELMASIRHMLSDSDVPGSAPPTAGISEPKQKAFTTIHVDLLPEDSLVTPSEEASDKILFSINNLAHNNLRAKVADIREKLDDTLLPWLAKYLIEQRVSIEPNNHELYRDFIIALESKPLWTFAIYETLSKAIALLNTESTQKNTNERVTLKNLGSWLGSITLRRDKPILHKNMAFKDFLLEGFDTNRLIVAIPFVCKILEGAAKSRVFQPPSPWLMGIINLLAELYHFAELKLNLKFEIEVLCKTLGLDLDKIEPTTILRNRPLADQMPEYIPGIDEIPMGTYDPSSGMHTDQVINLASGELESQRVTTQHVEAVLSSLQQTVVISPNLSPLNTEPTFKRAVIQAVDRTVREIIIPVVERSVTIAGISTRELVSKDFAMEASEERMRKAAHLMAQKLAGSLALVTCKEPLRSNLGPHLRTFLSERGFAEYLSENVISILVNDNLDIACQTIEKAAMDRAVSEVDEAFLAQYEMRRRHRETRPGLPFWDSTAPVSDYSNHLPDPLRLRPSGLQWPQIRVYDEFNGYDNKRKAPPVRPTSTHPFGRNDALPPMSRTPAVELQDRNQLGGTAYISQQEAMERFVIIMNELENVISQVPAAPLAALPQNHDLRLVVRQPLHLVMQCIEREKTALLMSQRIVQHLYKTQHNLGREICVAMLDSLCRTFRDVQKDATEWLIYSEDERKLNVPVTVALLRSGLITTAQQDQQLARIIWKDPKTILTDFTANLIRECVLSDPPVATAAQFPESVATLMKAFEHGKLSESSIRALEDVRIIRRARPQVAAPPTAPSITGKPESTHLNERLSSWFHQWVNLLQRSVSPDKAFIPYVSQLQKEGILKQEDISFLFFRVCTEASVEAYQTAVLQRGADSPDEFRAIDALSKLVSLIIRYHGEASAQNNDLVKSHYLTKILSIVTVVLAHAHEEQGTAFEQKPFFRFFSSLLNDLSAIEYQVGSAYFPLLLALSDTFSSLQPIYFPGFAFSWMALISHRLYLPKLLMSENRVGWSAFHTLMLSMFRFLGFFLKTPNLKSAGVDLYRGAARILLLLLHDFPDFLAEYYFTICDVIPANCIQLRNVVLSAFPPNITLPDPYLRTSQLDAIPEMGPIPPILSDFTAALQAKDLRGLLDQVLLARASPSALQAIKDHLFVPESPDDYDLPTINALVMYVGVSSVAQAKARSGSPLFVPTDPGVVLLQYLATNLDVEGQHHILVSMALHLRYPNAHTHWFSSLILHLFANVKDEKFREVTTTILLERFIGHRPHPWGVLVTFIELLANARYDFWAHEFVRAVPEIQLLLDSVARTIFQPAA